MGEKPTGVETIHAEVVEEGKVVEMGETTGREMATLEKELAKRSSDPSALELARAELDINPMELVAHLFAVASNIREHSVEKKQEMLEQVIGLLKFLEIEIETRSNPEKVKIIHRLFAFIPAVKKFIQLQRSSETDQRKNVKLRKQLVIGAGLLAKILGVDISETIPELKMEKKKERKEQLELYLQKIDEYLKDNSIKYGVRVNFYTGNFSFDWKLSGDYTVRDAIDENTIILFTDDFSIINTQLTNLLISLGTSKEFKITDRSLGSKKGNGDVHFWDLSDFTQILKDLKLEYTKELESLNGEKE